MATLRAVIDYIHAKPVRQVLVPRPEDWEWSSARWYARVRPVRLQMDRDVLAGLARKLTPARLDAATMRFEAMSAGLRPLESLAVGRCRRRFGTPFHEYVPGRATQPRKD